MAWACSGVISLTAIRVVVGVKAVDAAVVAPVGVAAEVTAGSVSMAWLGAAEIADAAVAEVAEVAEVAAAVVAAVLLLASVACVV